MRDRVRIVVSALAILVGLAILVALAMPSLVLAAQGSEALPPAREIIDQFVEAVGGREATLKHSSRRAVGKISMPAQGVEGDVEIHAARPALLRLSITMPGVGRLESGFDGTVAWSMDPLTGPMLMHGKSLDQAKADADFDSVLHSDSQFTRLETLERTTFEGRPAWKVRAVRVSGDEDLEFFDAETKLMLGAIVTRESPMGPVKATQVFSDFKDFGGGEKVASRIVQRMMGTEQVITIHSVEYDKVHPGAFALPPQIEALKK